MLLSRFKEYWWLIPALIPALVMLLTEYLYPLGYDNITYQSMAWQWVEFGRLPYIGTWDQNFPLIVYIHALAITLFGNTIAGFRTVDIILQLGSILILYHFTRIYFGQRAGIYAALIYTGMYLLYADGSLGQRDVYAAPAILAALYFLTTSRRDAKQFLAGVCIGFAIMIRPTYAFCAIPLLWLMVSKRDDKPLMKSIGLFIAGMVLTAIVILAPYFSTVRLHEFYLATIRFNLDVYGRLEFSRFDFNMLRAPVESVLTPLLAVSAYFLWKRTPEASTRRVMLALVVMLVILKILIYTMQKFLVYQYAPIYYLGLPLIAASIVSIESRLRVSRWLSVSLLTMLLLFLTFRRSPALVIAREWPNFSAAADSVNARFNSASWSPYDGLLNVVDHIQRTTSPTDLIEPCSWDNQIVWRSGRAQASRFTLIHPIGMRPAKGYTKYQLQWRREFVDVIERRVPKLVILAAHPVFFARFTTQPPSTILWEIPGFEDALSRGYMLDTVISSWTVYRRKD